MNDGTAIEGVNEGQVLKHELAEALAQDLSRHGQALELEGHLIGDGRVTGQSPRGNGDDRLVAVGRISRAAGALIHAILDLSATDNCVAISALSRQLVELEYLAWAMENNDAAPEGWLNSTKEERRKSWQPVHLRIRSDGHFRQEQYSTHCELGGHPTPDGLRVLLDPPDVIRSLLLLDALDHAIPIWRSIQTFRRSAASDEIEPLIEQWCGTA